MSEFQLDIDVGSSTVARGVVSLVLGYLNHLVIEMAFVIQVTHTNLSISLSSFLNPHALSQVINCMCVMRLNEEFSKSSSDFKNCADVKIKTIPSGTEALTLPV
jgi:hypothetical protein